MLVVITLVKPQAVANRAVHFYRNGTRLLVYVYRAVKVFFLRDKNKELECENRRLLVENASLRTRLELLDDSKNKTG